MNRKQPVHLTERIRNWDKAEKKPEKGQRESSKKFKKSDKTRSEKTHLHVKLKRRCVESAATSRRTSSNSHSNRSRTPNRNRSRRIGRNCSNEKSLEEICSCTPNRCRTRSTPIATFTAALQSLPHSQHSNCNTGRNLQQSLNSKSPPQQHLQPTPKPSTQTAPRTWSDYSTRRNHRKKTRSARGRMPLPRKGERDDSHTGKVGESRANFIIRQMILTYDFNPFSLFLTLLKWRRIWFAVDG